MKENLNSDDEDKIVFNNDDINNLNIKNENEENKDKKNMDILSISFDEEKKDISLKDIDIKVGSKMKCPEQKCFANAIININPFFFDINTNCGEHTYKLDIIDFTKKVFKEDKETCNICGKTYGDLKDSKINLYKCSCGKNICKKCKETMLSSSHDQKDVNEIKKEENHEKHVTIDFKEKDFKCICSNQKKRYKNFCLNCNQNLCQLCIEKHKDHRIFKFNKFKKEQLKEKNKKQKDIIKQFNKIIDEWLNIVVQKVKEYKKKLELYAKINETIIEQYNPPNVCYQTIKNVQYLNFDFDEMVLNLIKYERNMKKQTEIIFNFLNEKMKEYINLNPKEKEIQTIKSKNSYDIKDIVKQICELKKKGFLVIDVQKNEPNEELKIIKITNDYNFEKEMKSLLTENEKILNISELRNGNLLILQEKQFKIFDIDNDGYSTLLQTTKADKFTNFKRMIELSNGYLISLSQILNNHESDNITLWKKNLMKGEYENAKTIKKDTAIYLLEMDKNSFIVYCNDSQIYSYNSKSLEETNIGRIEINGTHYFKKILKMSDNDILLLFQELIIFKNLKSGLSSSFAYNINDICYIPDSNSSFLASYKTTDNFYSLSNINFNIIKRKENHKNYQPNFHTNIINCIFSLSNGDIITCSHDRTIKIWKIVTK